MLIQLGNSQEHLLIKLLDPLHHGHQFRQYFYDPAETKFVEFF